MWSIRWTETAVRDLRRLDPAIARRILARVEVRAANPERTFERLNGSPDYKLRVGDYRVFAALSYPDKTVIVERVGHRSTVYQR